MTRQQRAVAPKRGSPATKLRALSCCLVALLAPGLLAGMMVAAAAAAVVRPEAVPSPVPKPSPALTEEPRVFFQDKPKGLGEHFTAWKFNYVGAAIIPPREGRSERSARFA